MVYNTTAIILKQRNFQENDKLITAYTKDFGKLILLARGVKKIKSKLAGHIEPFFLSKITIAKGKRYDHLTGALVSQSFPKIRKNYEKIVFLDYLMEEVDVLVKTHHRDKKIFDLLQGLLKNTDKLEKHEVIKLYLLNASFILKLVSFLGFQPELYNCLKCKKRIKKGKIFFNPEKGGIICQNCHSQKDLEISANSVKICRLLLVEPLNLWLKKKIALKYLEEVNKVLNPFLEYHLEQSIKSLNFLIKESRKNEKIKF